MNGQNCQCKKKTVSELLKFWNIWTDWSIFLIYVLKISYEKLKFYFNKLERDLQISKHNLIS